ncbi:ferrochelatase [Helicobacter kayseriensis]|uniref:ferrochelatase n=1 Tax=Helicobacter kayseriensis TaxID=2905877 RepID=UPI0024B1C69C|nr:ferrochelatase [Helicobacter kayseriensis]
MIIKRAVVLLNMGGPSNLFEVETFLKNMFYDEHILRIKSRFLRKLVGSFIVNKRLSQAQDNYKKIGGKSPITPLTFALIEKLAQKRQDLIFTYAMRYTPPYAEMVAKDLQENGVEELLLFSLYPQYSTTTTLSSIKDFKQSMHHLNFSPQTKEIVRFYDHPLFLRCIQKRISEALKDRDPKDYVLIFSAHGLPQSIIQQGDPYQKECQHHVEILKDFLHQEGMDFEDVLLSYQSRLGPMKWIEPFTEDVVKTMKGKKVLIYPLAFTIDNSETHYELDIELRQTAQESGVAEFLVCACPNESDEFVELILNLVEGELPCDIKR